MQEALRKFKAEIFQALAHPTRVAIVEMLRDGEVPVAQIYEQLRIEPANASQHLSVLRAKYVVISRKEGNQVFYSVRDRAIIDVLDIMRSYFESHLAEQLAALNELSSQTTTATVVASDSSTDIAGFAGSRLLNAVSGSDDGRAQDNA